jgi:hypothetical protein
MKRLAAELFTIVVGILLALGVDEWRQDRAELRVVGEHLTDVAAELRSNLCSVERIRARALQRKLDGLQVVLRFLQDPAPVVEDPTALLQSFARSSSAAMPWLADNQYQSLQNSGNARLVDELVPGLSLAGTYEGPRVLFAQVERIQGAYPMVINELMPAQLQPGFSLLRGYAQGSEAPALEDDPDLGRAVARIHARRSRLIDLARNEAAVATAQWYALERLKKNYLSDLETLQPWDKDATPLEEQIADCRESPLPQLQAPPPPSHP